MSGKGATELELLEVDSGVELKELDDEAGAELEDEAGTVLEDALVELNTELDWLVPPLPLPPPPQLLVTKATKPAIPEDVPGVINCSL